MILGSDRRPKNNVEGASGGARSDTIMLVRLDPDKKATAIMSLPRDLKVEIPGHGTDKINAAYELGGPRLTLQDRQAAHRAARSTTSSTSTSTASGGRSTRSAASTSTSTGATTTTRPSTRTSTSSPATSASAGPRRSSTCASATRTPTSSAPRASRTSCARPSSRSPRRRCSTTSDRLMTIFGRNTSTDARLRSRTEVLRLLKLALFSATPPDPGDPASAGTLGPSYVETTRRRDARDDPRVPQRRGHAGAARRRRRKRSSAPSPSTS